MYRIEISKDGYEPITDNIQIERGTNRERAYSLEAHTGRLQFSVKPNFAQSSLIDTEGELVENWIGLKLLNDLKVGRYTLRIDADGFNEQTINFTIKEDQTEVIDVELEETIYSPEHVEAGKYLVTVQGCRTCHSINGENLIGPSFLNLYGSETKGVYRNGSISTVIIDDDFLSESILEPDEFVTNGYQNVMTPYFGRLNNDEVALIIEYLKSLSIHSDTYSNIANEDGISQSAIDQVLEQINTDNYMTPSIDLGKDIITQYACGACHNETGNSGGIGPTFKNLYRSRASVITPNGQRMTVTKDEDYIIESIIDPGAKKTIGYENGVMVAYDYLAEHELKSIVEYIKTLSNM